MSIDARVETVIHNEDGSGKLKLIARPDPRGPAYNGNKGQASLCYDKAPHEVTALNGCDVWGGSESLMLGGREIAKRVGYTKIEFCTDEEFKEAVKEYHAYKARTGK